MNFFHARIGIQSDADHLSFQDVLGEVGLVAVPAAVSHPGIAFKVSFFHGQEIQLTGIAGGELTLAVFRRRARSFDEIQCDSGSGQKKFMVPSLDQKPPASDVPFLLSFL